MIFIAKYLYLFEIIAFAIYFILQSKEIRKHILILSSIYLPTTYIVAKISSFIYFDPRPFIINHFVPLISHTNDNGFPSDHMLLTSAIASILFIYNKKLGIIFWIVAIMIGLSRVFVGVHHFIDIIGSAIISIITIIIISKYVTPKIMIKYKK